MKLYTQIADYFRGHPAAYGFLGGGTTLAAVDWERTAQFAERIRAGASTLTLLFSFIILAPQVYEVLTRWWGRVNKWRRGEPVARAKTADRFPPVLKRKGIRRLRR